MLSKKCIVSHNNNLMPYRCQSDVERLESQDFVFTYASCMVATKRDVCSRSIAGSHKNGIIGLLKQQWAQRKYKMVAFGIILRLITMSRHYFDIFFLVNTATPYNANAMIVYQDYWNWLIWIELLAFRPHVWHHLHIFIQHLSVTNCKHRGFEFLKWYSNGDIMAFGPELWYEPAVFWNWDNVWNNFSQDECLWLLRRVKSIRIYTHNNTVNSILYLKLSLKSRISSVQGN